MVDADLLDRLDRLASTSFGGSACRPVRPGYSPLSGEGARVVGGRWNPPDSFPTLYLGLDVDVVVAEFHRHLQRQGLRPEEALPRILYRYRLGLDQVLDLRDPGTSRDLGLDPERMREMDLRRCQAVGQAVHYLGREGILAPSAAGPGDVLALYLDRQRPDSAVEVVDSTPWQHSPA